MRGDGKYIITNHLKKKLENRKKKMKLIDYCFGYFLSIL